jgi:GDPmannose 4,6-dehydratase
VQFNRIAIITGITGQDGSYLAKLLIQKNYKVIGIVRCNVNSSFFGLEYLKIKEKIIIEECDLCDFSQIFRIISFYRPDEVYNLAAQSSVGFSFNQPVSTFHFNTISVFNLLESIKIINTDIKFYQASTSEMFGKVKELPINENSIFHPLSPYAISKASAHWICVHYRESYSLKISCGILFNHESFLRKDNFFVKKIIKSAINIYMGSSEVIQVGNLDISRDFGFAPKYVEAMYLMLQQNNSDDFMICSGNAVYLKDILYYVFKKLDISKSKFSVVKELYRPSEIQTIYGNPEKAKQILGWEYNYHIYDILDLLIDEELKNYIKNR